jgi:hypothetical protein
MGITQNSLDRFNRHIAATDTMLILGCQNMYNNKNYGEIARDYFSAKGFTVVDMDITGCQESQPADLREVLNFKGEFGIILQHGTIEHIEGSLYQPFKNIHEACAVNGIMIHENPMTGNWPEHGYHYFTQKFYIELAKACNYELLEVCSEPAMSNTIDGWNICAVLLKIEDVEFISEEDFNKIYSKHIKSK